MIFKFGDRNPEITEIQNRLNQIGYVIHTTGIFDKAMLEVIIQFQLANGLDPDGVIGDKTLKALQIYSLKPTWAYLVIHCTASKEGQNFKGSDVLAWHTNPCDLADGTVKYLGKVYKSRSELPKNVQKLSGRGWSKGGYREVYELDGTIFNMVNNDGDQYIDSWEISNGILGNDNKSAINICYVGGLDKDGKTPKDTRTAAQLEVMLKRIDDILRVNPDIKIGGHCQFGVYENGVLNQKSNNKACPCFSVPQWLRKNGYPEKNIYVADPFGYVKKFESEK